MREFSDKYLNLLTGKFAGINLTRILDADEFYYKQIIDSILPFDEIPLLQEILEKTQLVCDIGFGGGFPILPLAKKFPKCHFLGFEARRKKAEVVSEIASELKLSNAKLFHKRVEEINFNKSALITFKAVGKIAEFLPLVNSKLEQYVIFYKGPKVSELECLENIDGWKLISHTIHTIPQTEGREVLIYKKNFVPHGTIANKNLVNLSDLI